MARQQIGLVPSYVGELAFYGFGNASMKRATRLAQECAVGGVLHSSVLAQITGMRRHAPTSRKCAD